MIVTVDAYAFASIVRGWADSSPRAAYVSVLPVGGYEPCARYAAVRDGAVRAACAVTPDGELVSVVRLSEGTSDDVDAVIRHAIATGRVRYLGCFDGKLPAVYRKYGFTESDRWPWRAVYAPAAWNYGRDGRPDYLTLTLAKTSGKE